MTRAVADERHILTAAGVAAPRLIYGTAWKKERTAELVAQALRTGFRGIDTACQPKHYHEPGVGEALAVLAREGLLRSDIFLQTKFSPLRAQDPDNVPYDPGASIAQQVQQSFAVSLRNLGVDTIDSLVLHSPYPEDSDTLEAWGAMERLFDQGLVRQLGISNCYEPERFERLWRAARIKPAALQNRFHAKTHYDQALRAFCGDKNIVYQSFWTLTANPQILAAPAVTAIAEKYHRTPAQVFFRYLTQSGMACLTGTSSPEHMAQDLAIFDFRLTAREGEAIGALLGRASEI
jgi:diketogulonate reductase-like aldo/keto reductase